MRVVYATSTTSVKHPEGHVVLVRAGTHWPDDDPLVVQYGANLFSPDPRHGLNSSTPRDFDADAPVETATAAPGERRSVRRGPGRERGDE